MSVPPPDARLDLRFLGRMMRHGWYNLVIPWPGLGPRVIRDGRLPRYLLRDNATTLSDDVIEIFTDQLGDPARARAASALYRNFIQPEGMRFVRGKYRDQRLTTPTRLLIGAEDLVVRAESFESRDGLEVVEIDAASHFLVDDRPDEVVRHALEFFHN
jgi:pimeloyl-ACP methyl ester carboxylesterase